jgi:integrase
MAKGVFESKGGETEVVEALAKYSSIQKLHRYFLEKRGVDGGTPSFPNYVHNVLKFCEFCNKTPDQIVEEARKNSYVLYDPKSGSGLLEDYKLFLLSNKKPSNVGLRVRIACIKTWLRSNGVTVDLTNFVLPKTKIREKDDIPSDETLKLIMQNATLRMKTAIAILASSGIRVGALLGLKLKDVVIDYDKVNEISKITVPEHLSKSGESYVTFMSSEATKLLKQYLAYRKRSLHEDLTEESYVIGRKGEKFPYQSFQQSWIALLKKCGVAKKSYHFQVFRIHVLRKWFRTKAEELTPSVREKLLGHRGGYLDESYFKITEEQLLNEYKKIHASLLILEGPGETLKIVKEQSKMAITVLENLTKSSLLSQGLKKKEVEAKINELKNLLQRNPEEATKFALSLLQKSE